MTIRISERDIRLLEDLYRFNGLPAHSVIKNIFNNSTYGNRRLISLAKHDYIKKEFYYAQNKNKKGRFSQRIAAIYYVTNKGLQLIGKSIHPRYVAPDPDRLDVHNLIGNIYARAPNLLSRRDTLAHYKLKAFMPVSCAIPQDPPILIYILSKQKVPYEIPRITSFIEAQVIKAEHVIVSRIFEPEFLIPTPYFVPWSIAPLVIPNIATDIHYYTKKLIALFKSLCPNSAFTSAGPFIRAQTPHKTYNLATLMFATGLTRLNLQHPPKNTFIYTYNPRYLHGVYLQQGKLLLYSEQDQASYHLFAKDSQLYSVPLPEPLKII